MSRVGTVIGAAERSRESERPLVGREGAAVSTRGLSLERMIPAATHTTRRYAR
jgi:hypothetical protein